MHLQQGQFQDYGRALAAGFRDGSENQINSKYSFLMLFYTSLIIPHPTTFLTLEEHLTFISGNSMKLRYPKDKTRIRFSPLTGPGVGDLDRGPICVS